MFQIRFKKSQNNDMKKTLTIAFLNSIKATAPLSNLNVHTIKMLIIKGE